MSLTMSPNLVALLYLVAGVLFIQALRGSRARHQPARQLSRHDRHDDCRAHDARLASAEARWPGAWWWAALRSAAASAR